MLIPFDYLFKKYRIKTPCVLHLGANSGQEAEAYHDQGIKRVIWVEAISRLYVKLAHHIQQFPGQIALLACVSDTDGKKVTFHEASNDGQSSSFLELGTHAQEHPSVTYVKSSEMWTARVDTLLKDLSISIPSGSFLNVDLQGAELLALCGMGELLWQFDYAYIEVNTRELYKGCPHVFAIDRYLAKYGFEGKEEKMTGSGWGDRLYVAERPEF